MNIFKFYNLYFFQYNLFFLNGKFNNSKYKWRGIKTLFKVYYSLLINRPGLKIEDLVNLKKAFIELDTDNDGKIEYDVKKIPNSNYLLY